MIRINSCPGKCKIAWEGALKEGEKTHKKPLKKERFIQLFKSILHLALLKPQHLHDKEAYEEKQYIPKNHEA